MTPYRIFLSSPGDCTDERTAIHKIVAGLNADPLVASFAKMEVVAWDWGPGVPLEALVSPQSSVNEHLPLPEDCDLFLGIFRCRFGTPLPTREYKKVDGKRFLSGSEYEFHRAWDARRRGTTKPEILIYRLQKTDDFCCPEDEQFKNLKTFFNHSPFKEDNEWMGSINEYQPTDFAEKLEGHLRRLLSQRQPCTEHSFNDWLKYQAALLTTHAGPRYTHNAHLETDIGLAFDWLLARQPAISTLDKSLSKVWQEINRDAVFDEAKRNMEKIAEALRNDAHWQSIPDFNFMLDTLNRLETVAWEEHEKHEKADEETRKGEAWRNRAYHLRQLPFHARDTAELLKGYAALTNKRVLLLTGSAGQGKTHTLVHEINRTVNAGGIAIGVLGQMLNSSSDLWSAILKRVGWQGTTSQLLDKLENEAANRKQRALIVIDALNETPDRRCWRSELPGIVQEVLQRPHLTLAFSVRSDYLPQVLPTLAEGAETSWMKLNHPGFAGIEPDALLRYFELFGVKAPVAPPLGEFSNPLYVQLLAKSLSGKQLKHWLPSWLEVWLGWMERLEQEACDKLGLDDPSRRNPVHRTMNKLAQTMLDGGRFTLPRHQADEIARQTTGVDHVIGLLCSAGALIDRPDCEDEEVIEFGFERLSDTFLTDRLLENLFKGLSTKAEKHAALTTALATGGSLHPLASAQWIDHPLCYRRSGFLEALCLAVPPHIGAELPILIPQENIDDDQRWQDHDWQLAEAFNDSLRWRNRADEFGADAKELFALWQKFSNRHDESTELDELMRFALIPEHPFALEHVLHPHLLVQDSPGARDACWSIYLPRLWFDEHSNLHQLVVWARDAQLHGVHLETALPAARVLAWCSSTSQNVLRQAAMKGLTRLFVACPAILDQFLPDFLEVNDAYILEAVLVAVWGVMLDGGNPQAVSLAARLVYESQFPDGNARWCHITLRHYARRIVEEACQRGWLQDIDPHVAQPPYQSSLLLGNVPGTKDGLELLDQSIGFRRIISSSTCWDFYRYIMGGNSVSIEFSSYPMPNSSESARPFIHSESIFSHNTREDAFDLGLAGRFVAWNCLSLGWTAERFDEFDTGHYTREDGRASGDSRTERIGKKYQWISWHTLLAFLSDNYQMRPDWDKKQRLYDTPDQVGVDLHDPARWLQVVASTKKTEIEDGFWHIPSLPSWPLPNLNEIRQWVDSTNNDLPPTDVIVCVPELPKDWGGGTWLKLFSEHTWKSDFAPGQWALGRRFFTDIWWQISPMLIHADDLPKLLEGLEQSTVQENLTANGRIDHANDWHVPLAQWPTLVESWDEGFRETAPGRWGEWLPVSWRPVVGECGHPDRRDEHAPVCLPLPSLFQEWNLELDLRRGVVLHQGEPIFGLASWVFDEDALFARVEPLRNLIAASGYALIWCMRGERRAFLDLDNPHGENTSAWADYHGIGFLSSDGRVQTAWLHKEVRHS